MLEQNKKMDETQQRMKTLQGVEETGRSTNSMNEEMCEIEVVIEESYRISFRVLPNIMEIQK